MFYSDMDINVPKEEFSSAIWERYHNGKIRNVYPLMKYNDIIEKIKTAEENPPCNTPGEYYLLRKFIVVEINGRERLSCKPEVVLLSENSQKRLKPIKFYVALEEIYSYLVEAHKWVKHGCKDRLVRRIQGQGVVNITRDTVELFLSFCKFCRPRSRKCAKQTLRAELLPYNPLSERSSSPAIESNSDENEAVNSLTVKPLTVNEIKLEINPPQSAHTVSFTRGFIELMDYSNSPDGDYRYIFLYMDVQTCFCILCPVRCKCIFEISSHLLSVFTLIGPPQVLHSHLEYDFLRSCICNLKRSLPDLVLVSGSSNYAEVQAVAQNCISEVDGLLKEWMTKNISNNWSNGLKLTQLKKNTQLPGHSTKSPFECFFGRSVNSNLLQFDLNVLRTAEKEDHLLTLINDQAHPQPYEQLQVSVDPDICRLVQSQVQDNCDVHSSKRNI